MPKLRAKIGMVFQNFELFPHMKITENLTIGRIKVLGRSPDEARERGLKMLDRVGKPWSRIAPSGIGCR